MVNHIATSSTMTETYRPPTGFAALLGLTLALALPGCSSFSDSSLNASKINPVNWISPYRADIIQGNFVSKEQVEILKAGMTRAQVKEVLGTPLLSSLFHQDRWDYVFTLKRTGVAPQAFRYTVFFKGDQLERFAGDSMPSEAEFIATLASARKFDKAPALQATDEQLKSAQTPSSPTAAAAEAGKSPASTPAQATVYPPLEGAKR